MTETSNETNLMLPLMLPFALCRGAVHVLSVAGSAQKAAMDEFADLNRELFQDFVNAMHSTSLLSNEFWHARTVAAATRAIEEFAVRQERILRRESHRWTEHCHRLLDGTLHPTAQTRSVNND